MKKLYPCFVCEKRYAEIEEAEVCEQSHATPARERERGEDDGRDDSHPGNYIKGYED